MPLTVQAPRLAQARRACGGCTACCTALIINDASLVVPGGTHCPHECAAGCSIHGSRRPALCGEYFCNYAISSDPLSESERPDRVGAIVERKHNAGKAPPMHRTTHVVACAPGGLDRVIENHYWHGVIRADLAAGIPILAAQYDDPLNREVLGVRLQEERLFCRLTSCTPDGSPVLTTLQPAHHPPVQIALLIPAQGFIFETDALIRVLGNRRQMIVTPSVRSTDNEVLRFLFTQRQAAWVRRLAGLLDVHPESSGRPRTAGHS